MYTPAPILSASWKDDTLFATCGGDKLIIICEVGTSLQGAASDMTAKERIAKAREDVAIHVLRGHKDEVNSVAWDASGTMLASGSDDYTVKVTHSLAPVSSRALPRRALGVDLRG